MSVSGTPLSSTLGVLGRACWVRWFLRRLWRGVWRFVAGLCGAVGLGFPRLRLRHARLGLGALDWHLLPRTTQAASPVLVWRPVRCLGFFVQGRWAFVVLLA